jgi:hypothetical protein
MGNGWRKLLRLMPSWDKMLLSTDWLDDMPEVGSMI